MLTVKAFLVEKNSCNSMTTFSMIFLNGIFFIQFHLNILNHTPLAHAILNNHIEIVEHLLSQPDVDINERYI